MNNVQMIGRVATDAKIGNGVASSLLAVKRIYHSRDGVDTDFIPLSVFGHQAENFSKMVKKGEQIGVDGRIKTSEYEDKNGSKQHGWCVVVNHFYLLGSSKGNDNSQHDHNRQAKVDKQLDNLDQVLDNAKEAKQQHKPMPVLSGSDPCLIAHFDIDNDSSKDSNRAHEPSNDLNKKVIDSQPTIEELEREIKDLKARALPF